MPFYPIDYEKAKKALIKIVLPKIISSYKSSLIKKIKKIKGKLYWGGLGWSNDFIKKSDVLKLLEE